MRFTGRNYLMVAAPLLVLGQAPERESMAKGTPLSLEYTVVGGKDLGGGVHYRDSRLTIDFERELAEYWQYAPGYDPDTKGEPIGYFRAPISKERLNQVLKESQGSLFESPPAPAGEGMGSSLISLRLRDHERTFAASFLTTNHRALQHFERLLEAADLVEADTFEKPLQAIQLQMKGAPGADRRFHFAIKNIGTMPVLIGTPIQADPSRSGVRVALAPVEKPGFTSKPPEWSTIALRSQEPRAASFQKLDSGATVELASEPWAPGKPGRYFAQAMLGMFEGPPAHDGLPVMRGRLFSPYLKFDVP
jgi:hypothetical protein